MLSVSIRSTFRRCRVQMGVTNKAQTAAFEPSIVQSLSAVQHLHSTAKALGKQFAPLTSGDGFKLDSECFHRATVWQYLLDKKFGLKSQKIFVFYTHKFRSEYKRRHMNTFGWWFHTAPLILVRVGDQIEERVIDPTYSDEPLTVHEWTNMFVDTQKKCRDDLVFKQFSTNVAMPGQFPNMESSGNRTQDCFVDRSPMYDLDPEYVLKREQGKSNVQDWLPEVVDQASYAYGTLGPRGRFRNYVYQTGY